MRSRLERIRCLALTRLFKCLKVFFERLADTLKQSPVFFPFLSRESAVRSVEVRQKFLLRKFHSFFRPPQVFQRFLGWHVALFWRLRLRHDRTCAHCKPCAEDTCGFKKCNTADCSEMPRILTNHQEYHVRAIYSVLTVPCIFDRISGQNTAGCSARRRIGVLEAVVVEDSSNAVIMNAKRFWRWSPSLVSTNFRDVYQGETQKHSDFVR